MTVLTRNPSNPNPLQPNKFLLSFGRAPNMQYFCQNVSVPGLSLSEVMINTPFVDIHSPGEKAVYDLLNITFIVDESAQLALNRVFNYPNPFNTETRFQFEHNRAGEPLEVDIQIFEVNGQRVKRIQQELTSEGNRVSQTTWDGTSDSGNPIASGLYVYRVIVKSTVDGSTATDYSKLVYIK